MLWVIKPIRNRFRVYGQQTEKQKTQDLQDTIKELNERLKTIEEALNDLQNQITP